MREIKFRGFHVNEYGNTVITVNGEDYKGKWVYGYYYELKGTAYIIEKGTGYFDISCGERIFATAYCREVLSETIGQFTGLTDKNGKEIYEGDVCSCFEYECSGKVEWDNDDGGFYFYIFEDNGMYDIEHLCDYIHELEVIGSIFDNPEEIESEE